MKSGTFTALILATLLPLATLAQSTAPAEFAGVRFAASNNPFADSNATFAVGLTTDDGKTFVKIASTNQSVRIIGKFRPEAAHVGQKASIYVVDRNSQGYVMRNKQGGFQPWNFIVPDLVPYLEDVTLTAELQLDVFTGPLAGSGLHRFHIGYKPAGGNLYYTPVPHVVEATQQSASDRAYTQFVSSISPNIVQSRCVLCHVKGGAAEAGGASNIFEQPLTTSLAVNFAKFQKLLTLRGVNFVLAKVTGGNNHGGGVQLVRSSAEYEDLASFLNLMAQDLTVPTTPAAATEGGTAIDPSDPYYAENPY